MITVVDVELTPNPHAIKFILDKQLLKRENRQFTTKADTENDPLAKGIFEIDGIETVFYSNKFITLEKKINADWAKIQTPLMKFLAKFDPADIPAEKEVETCDENTDELFKQISAILDEKVMPALSADGGGLEVLGLDGMTLRVRYQGACGSCPSATRGTLMAIQNLLQHEVNPNIEVIPS